MSNASDLLGKGITLVHQALTRRFQLDATRDDVVTMHQLWKAGETPPPSLSASDLWAEAVRLFEENQAVFGLSAAVAADDPEADQPTETSPPEPATPTVIHWVMTDSASSPDDDNVRAGLDHNGNPALDSGTLPIKRGAVFVGLPLNKTSYLHMVLE